MSEWLFWEIKKMISLIKKNLAIVLLIIIAFASYMLTIIPSGSQYCFGGTCGLYFWGAHGHDAIWHLAIVAISFNHFPFVAPTFSGEILSSYNYFLDVLMGISATASYFKILPIVWFGLFSYLLLKLSEKIHKEKVFAFIFLFFVFFSGSFSFVITWIHDKTIWGSSGLLAMQSLLSLTNLQYAFSLVIITLILVVIKSPKPSLKNIIMLGFLVAINLALKFYAGIISGFIVLLYFALTFYKSKDILGFIKSLLFVGGFSLIVIFFFYGIGGQTNGGLPLVYSPFSTVYPIIEEPKLLYMKNITNAKYFLENSGRFSPRLVVINMFVLGLYIVFNFGTRMIGLIYLLNQALKRKIMQFDIIVFLTVVFSLVLSIFFIQRGVWWNTVQFSYYAFFLSNIFAAETIYLLIKKNKTIGAIITSVILLLTVPTSLDIIRTFGQPPGHVYLPKDEIVALDFLKKQPYGVVFSPLPTDKNRPSVRPLPIYSLGDSSYITAFSNKQSFIADEVQLQLVGIDYRERADMSRNWNCDVIRKANYLYELKQNPIGNKLNSCRRKFKKIYKNNLVTVYITN